MSGGGYERQRVIILVGPELEKMEGERGGKIIEKARMSEVNCSAIDFCMEAKKSAAN